jgi:hypothetical protein
VDWGPEQLKGFQSLDFLSEKTKNTFHLEPGRGQGRRPKGVGRIAYNNAVAGELHKTQERTTAEQFDYASVLKGIDAGTVEVTRKTKAGKPLSVRLNGKTIRLSTLRKSQSKPSTGEQENDTTGSHRQQPHRVYQRGRDRNRGLAR